MTVIFDGREHERVEAAAGSIGVGFAPGGRDAADREIVRRVRADSDAGSITACTTDRRLRAALKAAGAPTISSGELLRILERSEHDGARAARPES